MTNNLFATLRARVLTALHAVIADLPAEIAARVEVTPTREEAHGDAATNAAMVAAKAAGRNPRELAGAIAQHLAQDDAALVAEASVAGPGFINIKLHRASLLD